MLGTGTALLAVLLSPALLTGCSPDPRPAEPFAPITLNEFGGVDGRDHLLTVEPDGTALLLGGDPQAGSLSSERMGQIEELVTGEQFRTEAATDAPEPSDRCSDQVTLLVRMGSLQVGRSMTCRSIWDRTPAFDELVGLLEIEGSLRSGRPALQEMEVAYTDGSDGGAGSDGGGSFVLSAAGEWTARTDGGEDGGTQRDSLDSDDRDTLRLLQARLVERGPVPVAACEPSAGEQVVTLAGREYHLSPCQPTRDDRELRSLWTVVTDVADLPG